MKYLLILIAFAGTRAMAQDIKYTSGNNAWNADSLGNHRVVVYVPGNAKAAYVKIAWRRPDRHPEAKRIIVQDARTGNSIANLHTGLINNEYGEVWFEPVSGKGTYYVYYMPYRNEGRSNYPKGVYLQPEQAAAAGWSYSNALPAIVKEIEAIDAFNSFYPMQVIATAKETARLTAGNGSKKLLVFPEDRLHPVIMRDFIPQRWTKSISNNRFTDTCSKGEYFTFQLGVLALQDVEGIQVAFTDLRSGTAIIPKAQLNCFNTGGNGYNNNPEQYTVDVPAGKVQSLWCGIAVPENIAAGKYTGKLTVQGKGTERHTIDLAVVVTHNTAREGNIGEPWKQTRLHWLNSSLAQENTVIAPYMPLRIEGDTAIALLGRRIIISKEGFPKQIQTYFTPEMTGLQQQPNDLLYEPVHFHFTKESNGKDIKLQSGPLRFTERSEGTVQWDCSSGNDSLQLFVHASLEFDGFMRYMVKLVALQDIAFKDIVMHIPFQKDKATYLMGLGQKGGYRPEKLNWKWEVATKNQDGAWIGNVNAGLQYSLRDENYMRPLNTNFYLQKPLRLPSSWGNEGKGGIDIGIKGSSMLVNNYSGARVMKKGDTLYYNFNLLITPFHPINTSFQWATRFFHKYDNLDSIKATGATVVNIHHATPINPYINYPFIEYKKMKSYIDEAHAKGLKVKIYNTIRELSNSAYELQPLRSLGHEIFSDGKGGGFSWLQEHLDSNYIAAWFVPEIKDAAIVNSGMSRWHNYYVEGMNWLVKHVGIDGIYLDDVAFDRVTMKRIKRVLTAGGHPGIIDLHSANQYNKNDGFNNSANLYMEHFPYLSRLWFGEYFDYEKNDPDFFLTEVSGIPFGLMGEMLQDGGNPYRGMLYGMTNRMPWSDNADPRPLWKTWDDFGIQSSSMIGYWSGNCPVRTTDPQVLATVYKKEGTAMVAIASWAAADTSVKLVVDWQQLGIDKSKAVIDIPYIENFQQQASVDADGEIAIKKNKGCILVIREQ